MMVKTEISRVLLAVHFVADHFTDCAVVFHAVSFSEVNFIFVVALLVLLDFSTHLFLEW
jgi:hypothetical protein